MGRRHFVGTVSFGFLLGLGAVLYVAWVLSPVDFSNADVADLRNLHKDEYIRMIATEYILDGDFALIQRQLQTLRVSDLNAHVFDLARTEPNALRQQALIRLYQTMQNPSLALNVTRTATPRATIPGVGLISPTPSRKPSATPAFVVPSRTPTLIRPTLEPTLVPPTAFPNLSAPLFKLADKEPLTCHDTDEGVIQVIVRDANGNDLAGIAVQVAWATGHETFYTGLKPERGIGFADYAAQPETYTVRLTENARSQVVDSLTIEPAPSDCANSDATRGWKLIFQQA